MSLIEVDRNFLLAPLQTVIGAVESRQTMPILSNVLLEVGEGRLSVTATDLAMQVTVETEAEHGNDVRAITVSARKLLDILRQLPEDASVALDLHDTRLRIASGDCKFSLKTLPAEDFPKLGPASEAAVEVALPERALKQMLALTQLAMGERDARHYLNGALFSLREDALVVVATDGFRLALASFALKLGARPIDVILPRKAVIELFRLLSASSDDPARLCVMQNRAAFNFGRVSLITAVVDGTFPRFEKMIPLNCEKRFCVDRVRLQQALQRVAILVSKFRGVRWTVGNERLRIEAVNDHAEEAEEAIPVDYSGEAIDRGYNVGYVMDALTSAQSDQIECAFADSGDVMLVTIPGRGDFKHIVMPMRI